MSKYNKYIYIGILIIILFAVFIIFSSTLKPDVKESIPETSVAPTAKNIKPVTASPAVKTQTNKETKIQTENTQSVTVLAGDTTAHVTFAPNTVFYDALVQAKNSGLISFNGKDYPGLGFFVTDIGTLHAGDGKSLLYYINGKEATVGVSSYILKDGDIILWKLE